MDKASFAVWRRLQSIQQEYRLILQELRHMPRRLSAVRATEPLGVRMRG
jgi:hypothetical protein